MTTLTLLAFAFSDTYIRAQLKTKDDTKDTVIVCFNRTDIFDQKLIRTIRIGQDVRVSVEDGIEYYDFGYDVKLTPNGLDTYFIPSTNTGGVAFVNSGHVKYIADPRNLDTVNVLYTYDGIPVISNTELFANDATLTVYINRFHKETYLNQDYGNVISILVNPSTKQYLLKIKSDHGKTCAHIKIDDNLDIENALSHIHDAAMRSKCEKLLQYRFNSLTKSLMISTKRNNPSRVALTYSILGKDKYFSVLGTVVFDYNLDDYVEVTKEQYENSRAFCYNNELYRYVDRDNNEGRVLTKVEATADLLQHYVADNKTEVEVLGVTYLTTHDGLIMRIDARDDHTGLTGSVYYKLQDTDAVRYIIDRLFPHRRVILSSEGISLGLMHADLKMVFPKDNEVVTRIITVSVSVGENSIIMDEETGTAECYGAKYGCLSLAISQYETPQSTHMYTEGMGMWEEYPESIPLAYSIF